MSTQDQFYLAILCVDKVHPSSPKSCSLGKSRCHKSLQVVAPVASPAASSVQPPTAHPKSGARALLLLHQVKIRHGVVVSQVLRSIYCTDIDPALNLSHCRSIHLVCVCVCVCVSSNDAFYYGPQMMSYLDPKAFVRQLYNPYFVIISTQPKDRGVNPGAEVLTGGHFPL